MTRGVSFKVSQATTDTLWQILGGIDVEIFDWYNVESQNEVWTDIRGDVFFDTDYYSGKDFSLLIQKNHYIVFLKLQAYNSTHEFNEIHTYEEFLKSSCQLIVLIYDCEFVEIFAKNAMLIENLFENALRKKFLNVTQITDFNDSRTAMDIL
jgi:hypothetical protein